MTSSGRLSTISEPGISRPFAGLEAMNSRTTGNRPRKQTQGDQPYRRGRCWKVHSFGHAHPKLFIHLAARFDSRTKEPAGSQRPPQTDPRSAASARSSSWSGVSSARHSTNP